MNRRNVATVAVIIGLAPLAVVVRPAAGQQAQQPSRPNIVLIFPDNTRRPSHRRS